MYPVFSSFKWYLWCRLSYSSKKTEIGLHCVIFLVQFQHGLLIRGTFCKWVQDIHVPFAPRVCTLIMWCKTSYVVSIFLLIIVESKEQITTLLTDLGCSQAEVWGIYKFSIFSDPKFWRCLDTLIHGLAFIAELMCRDLWCLHSM